MPFAWCDGTCEFWRKGLQTSCIHGGFFRSEEIPGAQAEAVRVPLADGTFYKLSIENDDSLLPALLTLSDVMDTGHHAAVAANVGRGSTVAFVGDGAVGLCGVIAAKRLGAEQIIIMGHHQDRIGTTGVCTLVVQKRRKSAFLLRILRNLVPKGRLNWEFLSAKAYNVLYKGQHSYLRGRNVRPNDQAPSQYLKRSGPCRQLARMIAQRLADTQTHQQLLPTKVLA